MRVYLVGGGWRAVPLLREYLTHFRGRLDPLYAVFMRGHPDEHEACRQLVDLAQTHGLAHVVSETIDDEICQRIKRDRPDVVLTLGLWRSHIPDDFLHAAKLGFISLHGSGLPAYRGWAGLYWYVMNGEAEYKMAMFQLATQMDAGPLVADKSGRILEYSFPIAPEAHIGEILQEVEKLHVRANMDLAEHLLSGDFQFVPQDESLATYSCHRGEADGEIDWSLPTKKVFDAIRAQSRPCPGAFTYFKGEKIRLWRAKPRYDFSNYVGRIPGKVVVRDLERGHVIILTGDGAIEVVEAENLTNGETSPLRIFTSLKDRCKSRVEAFIDKFHPDF